MEWFGIVDGTGALVPDSVATSTEVAWDLAQVTLTDEHVEHHYCVPVEVRVRGAHAEFARAGGREEMIQRLVEAIAAGVYRNLGELPEDYDVRPMGRHIDEAAQIIADVYFLGRGRRERSGTQSGPST